MFYSININFKHGNAIIEKRAINNTAPYRIPNVIISTKDDNAMEYLSMDYLGLYNSSLCEFCERNNLCLECKEDSNGKIMGKVYLLNKITQNTICSAETLESVVKYIETLIENKNNENNV